MILEAAYLLRAFLEQFVRTLYKAQSALRGYSA